MPSFSLLDHGLMALAAGGTLITFPALVAIGAGKVSATVTNTVALTPGYFGGTLALAMTLLASGSARAGSRRQLRSEDSPARFRLSQQVKRCSPNSCRG